MMYCLVSLLCAGIYENCVMPALQDATNAFNCFFISIFITLTPTLHDLHQSSSIRDEKSIKMINLEKENSLLKTQIAQLQAIIEQNKTNQHVKASEATTISTTNRFEMLLDMDDEEENLISKDSLIDNIKKKKTQEKNTGKDSTVTE